MKCLKKEKGNEYPTKQFLDECFIYVNETGELRWKKRPLTHFKNKHGQRTFNSKYAGMVAGNFCHGYHQVWKLYAHRVIFIMVNGYNPENNIDHIDRNPSNNRIVNLREASQSCNMRNQKKKINNTSGVTGVCWDKGRGYWFAQIKFLYKNRFLGYYKSFDNAVCARLAGEQCLNWVGCNSNSAAYKYVKRVINNG